MGRTIRDIPVYNRTLAEVMNEIMAWINSHKQLKIEENRGTYLTVKIRKSRTEKFASLVMSNKKVIEINVKQTSNGIVVHTEGYVKPPIGSAEQEFSSSALSGGVPRREGWRLISDLWQRLSTLSGAPTQQAPNVPPPPQNQQTSYPPPPPPQYQQASYPPPPPPQNQQASYPPPPPPQNQQQQSPQKKEVPPPPAEGTRQETQTSSKIPKFCSFCGTYLGERPEKAKFCPYCGEKG